VGAGGGGGLGGGAEAGFQISNLRGLRRGEEEGD
jgi:hypothetical protein